MATRKPYPSDVSDEEWGRAAPQLSLLREGAGPRPPAVPGGEWPLVAPYLTLLREDAAQREHPLREAFTGLRYLVRYGVAWRAMPPDPPPWPARAARAP